MAGDGGAGAPQAAVAVRPPEQRADRRAKDLAAMARAGFAFDVCRK